MAKIGSIKTKAIDTAIDLPAIFGALAGVFMHPTGHPDSPAQDLMRGNATDFYHNMLNNYAFYDEDHFSVQAGVGTKLLIGGVAISKIIRAVVDA